MSDLISRKKDDSISRQMAIDVCNCAIDLWENCIGQGALISVKEKIGNLPSTQPEIIRCKDCKFYGRADKRRFYRGSDCLNKRIDTIVPDRDFCSRAEKSGADMRGDENGEHD